MSEPYQGEFLVDPRCQGCACLVTGERPSNERLPGSPAAGIIAWLSGSCQPTGVIQQSARDRRLGSPRARGGHPYVKSHRITIGFALSLASIAFWIAVGHPSVVLLLLGFNVYNGFVTSSLRGTVEHHSYVGDDRFANEYKVWIPLFNLNRHVHHHVDPSCPWYLLEFRTDRPLPAIRYLTHWYHVYVKRDYVLMQPPPRVS